MEFINIESLNERKEQIKADYQSKKPFRFTSFEGIFYPEKAEIIHSHYPVIEDGKWDGTTYINQKNKFMKTTFDEGSVLDKVFKELNSEQFLGWLKDITEMEEDLIGDPKLFGGGLHQSIYGAYLNVHVDYNIHPETKYHRRLNVLAYMNKDWKDEYEGHLELWNFQDNKKELLDKISPMFNRCAMFETNEISYHGHPKPLNTPKDINRKSIAVYYYTKNRDPKEVAQEHNTIYVNTEGVSGEVKKLFSGVKAFFERIKK
jgi:Rps23 Pro-64 3,4-dihydroxylase Tpa1-like proline 4-hydroxylase